MLLHRLGRHVGKKPAKHPAAAKPAAPKAQPPAALPAPAAPAKRRGVVDVFNPARAASIQSGVLTALLNKQDAAPETSRDLAGSDYLHWSSLLRGLCLRQIRFADADPAHAHVNRVQGAMRIVWAIGRAVEHHIRTQYMALVHREGVLGKWECVCGETSVTEVYRHDFASCPLCGNKPDVYKEMQVQCDIVRIKGHPDLLIYLGGKLYVLEIKSINDREYKELKAAKPDHVYQGMGYRRMLKLMGYNVADEIIVIYATKDYKFGSPYHDFVVPVTDATERVLDGLWKKAGELRKHRDAGTRPPRTECRDTSSPMAKDCPFLGDCFQRQ